MPMVVSVILIGLPRRIGFCRVIDASVITGLLAGTWRVSRKDRTSLLQLQVHVAFQMNRKAKIGPLREAHSTSPRCRSCLDRMVHRDRIQRLAIPRGPVLANIER